MLVEQLGFDGTEMGCVQLGRPGWNLDLETLHEQKKHCRVLLVRSQQSVSFLSEQKRKSLPPLTLNSWYKNILSGVYLSPCTISSHLKKRTSKLQNTQIELNTYIIWWNVCTGSRGSVWTLGKGCFPVHGQLNYFFMCWTLALIGKQNTAKHFRFNYSFSLYNLPQYSKKYDTSGSTDNINSKKCFTIISQRPL